MRQAGIVPAEIDFSDPAAPRAPAFGDVYHARDGAAAQAEHVFLRGNGLPARWRDRGRFVILETGFGLGHNFLAAWAAWRTDPRRCGTLWFASIDKHPPTQHDLRRAHGGAAADAAAAALADAWPPLLPGLHPIAFEQGRVRLLLGFGDAQAMLRELVLQADAVFLDGFAPSCNPQMWDRRLFLALPRLLAPGATAATWSVARDVREGLGSAGFEVERAPGFAGKREMTVARHAPRHLAPPPAGRIAAAPRDALIVGAGLAGAAAAQALARLGVGCTMVEAAQAAANGGSGLPAGLFHGLVHGANGAHARLLRAAALAGARDLAAPIASGAVTGSCAGLMRLEAAGTDAATLARDGTAALGFALPAAYARPVSAAEASALAGVPLTRAGWWTPHGGWLHPAALVAHRLAHAGVRPILGRRVEGIMPLDGRWAARDAAGRVIAAADVLVLANAADAARLAGTAAAGWRLQRLRGQVSVIAAAQAGRLPRPQVPLAGAGYLIPLPEGGCLAGATTSAADPAGDDPSPHAADDDHNLARLAALLGLARLPEGLQPTGEVGWRCATADRLPLIGALPDPAAAAGMPRPVRHRPRIPGLYTLGALGSRGITLSTLCGEILAATITGAPLPVEASLMDAVDAARHLAEASTEDASPAH